MGLVVMERIWAPWREKYVSSPSDKCIFCSYKEKIPEERDLSIHYGKFSFIILNKYPYNGGHLLIAPYRHITDFLSLRKEEITEIFSLIRLSVTVLNKVMKPQGYNLGANIGKVAGAGFEHFHFHIVPRWKGDTNFLPVISDTKVVSVNLFALRDKLRKEFNRVLKKE